MSNARARRRPVRIAAAAMSLIAMLVMLGRPPVQRTQEARVLETAREMLGHPAHDWIIPRLNGEIRLEKPPLAYWLAAAAFEIGGVSEGVGRVPFALAGWLTLILVYFAGRWIAGERSGYIAALALMGMWMFTRHARLAETDLLATLFVTAACFCIWRGATEARDLVWFALSGAAIGLAAMGKGLPAAFPILFLIALVIEARSTRLLSRWLRSGAPVIAIAIGATWYIYAVATVNADKFTLETKKGLFGLQHVGSFLQYFPDLVRATLPWTPVVVAAIWIAITRWRSDSRARRLILWFAAIFVPLLIAGQRQFHYLFPALPPLALLIGWLIEAGISQALRERFKGAVVVAAAAVIVVITSIAQLWLPARQPTSPRTVAARIKQLGNGPYCFYGENVSLPVTFYLGRTIKHVTTPEQLNNVMTRAPATLVIAQTKSAVAPPPLPASLMRVTEIPSDDQLFEIYRAAP